MNDRQHIQRNEVHPHRDTLRAFTEKSLSSVGTKEVEDHLAECEFCRVFCENYGHFLEADGKAIQGGLPQAAQELADRLYYQSVKGRTIPLAPLGESSSHPEILLAADSDKDQPPMIQSLTTQYSEDPEVILRLMHDTGEGLDYLQLIAEDKELVSNVLIQIPGLQKEYLTDNEGRATVDDDQSIDWSSLKWQIKMPEAVFELEPLRYDPDKVISSKEFTLETDDHSKIRVLFESRVEGKRLSLQVLQLEGQSDFDTIRVSVSHGDFRTITEATADESLTFDLTGSEERIDIRLFD